MREHLLNCFVERKLLPFPRSNGKHVRKLRRTQIVNIELYKCCYLPDIYGDMVACDKCSEWFHKRCLDVEGLMDFTNISYWQCSKCT